MSISTIAELTTAIADLVKVMRSTTGFKLSREFKDAVNYVARQIEIATEAEAIKSGFEVMRMGRAILTAFFRNSVIDYRHEGELQKIARFSMEMNERRDNRHYDEDLIAKLEKTRKVLEQAVRTETGDFFTERLTAYNAMCAEIEAVDTEQKRRDRVRKVRDEVAQKAKKTAAEAEAAARSRAQAATAREALLKERRSQAQSLIELLN